MKHSAEIWVTAERLDQLDAEAMKTAERAFADPAAVTFSVEPQGDAGVYEQTLSGPPAWQQYYLVKWHFNKDTVKLLSDADD